MAGTKFADRNLLIGVLALQNYLIDSDQLLQAMQAWLKDKSQNLEDILTQQGVLDSDECRLLLALTKHHLAKHNDEPEKSLEALSAIGTTIREELADLSDEQVNASLVHIPANPGVTQSYQPPPTPEGVRYRVLRKHAHGGLGDVFVAMDQELKRDVALKQIQERFADDPGSRSRFMLEAEVTGRLEHPGIVPVYGLGLYDDGRPFYAMRFIRGDSLHEAIEEFHAQDKRGDWVTSGERSVQLRKLLGRFLDVCDAIEYAHSRGVLHRDLKPGNVMLGNHGETLVVDWGLAKLVNPSEQIRHIDQEPPVDTARAGDSHTQMGTTVGTPAYMSPEQAAGRLDLLDGRSDVYSLGATLFCLLTGQAPVRGETPEDIRRQVEKGRIPKPREINSRVPRALEAICVKSMALEPQNRYTSPNALAADIERWLADEPISAYKDPILIRAARWSRHHKVTVAALLVLLVTGLLSVSTGAAMLSQANRRILAAQQKAEENEKIANQNFELARNAVEDYLTQVSEETLLDQPGMQPLRKKLLTEALDYYRQFVQRREDDPNARSDLASAFLRMGIIVSRMESHDEAIAYFQQAQAIAEALVKEDPRLPTNILSLVTAHEKLATEYHTLGRYAEALDHYARVTSTLEPLMNDPKMGSEARLQIAQAYTQIGSIHSDEGRAAEALELYQRAESTVRSIDDAFEDFQSVQDVLARSLHNQCTVQRVARNFQQALTPIREAVSIREQLATEAPEVQGNQQKLTLSLGAMATIFSELGRHDEARSLQERVIDIRRKLADENPAVAGFREELANAQVSLATTERILGNLERAKKLSDDAADTLQLLVQRYPDVLEFQEVLALNYFNTGNLFLGDPVSTASVADEALVKQKCAIAVEHYLKAISTLESLVEKYPRIPDFRSRLANALNNCSSAYNLIDEDAKSQSFAQRALEIREQLVADSPTPDYRQELASSLYNSAGSQADPAEQIRMLKRATDLRQELVNEFPDVPTYRSKLAFSLQGLALNHFQQGDVAAALAPYASGIAIYEQLHKEFPAVEGYRQKLLQSLELQSIMLRLANQLDDAEKALLRIVELQQAWLVDHPNDITAGIRMSKALRGIGMNYHKAEQFEQAFDYYDKAQAALEYLPDDPSTRNVISDSKLAIQELRIDALEQAERFAEAAEMSDLLIAATDQPVSFHVQTARLYALAGNAEEATKRAEALLKDHPEDEAGQFYNLACVFSLAAAAGNEAGATSESQAHRIAQALLCLEKAKANGYFTDETIELIEQDSDFTFIRDNPELQSFIGSLSAPAPQP